MNIFEGTPLPEFLCEPMQPHLPNVTDDITDGFFQSIVGGSSTVLPASSNNDPIVPASTASCDCFGTAHLMALLETVNR